MMPRTDLQVSRALAINTAEPQKRWSALRASRALRYSAAAERTTAQVGRHGAGDEQHGAAEHEQNPSDGEYQRRQISPDRVTGS
jgi:hypothetical protein